MISKGKILTLICLVPLAAAAFPLSVGGFYSPGLVVGDAANDAAIGHGVKGRIAIGDGKGLTPRITVGYARLHYGLYNGYLLAIFSTIEDYDVITVDAGVDYGLTWGRLNPFVGGGFVCAVEMPQFRFYETVADFAPGISVGGGARLRLNDKWALELAPRYTYLFDEPAYANAGTDRLLRSGARSQIVEVPLGVVYTF